MNVVFETLERVYREQDTSSLQPYSGFIEYTTTIDASDASEYWNNQLHEARRATWPPLDDKKKTKGKTEESESRLIKKSIPFPKSTKSSITKATIIRAAWAIVLARWCDSDDIAFGTTVSGRQAHVAGIETMAGPMVATVPIRSKIDKDQKVKDYLLDVQKQSNDMTKYEQFGLQNISKVGSDAQDACEFSSLLVIQPADIVKEDGADKDAILVSGGSEKILAEEAMRNYFSYPLVLQSHVLEDKIDLIYVFDENLVNEQQLSAFSHQFNTVIQQLLTQSDSLTLGTIAIAGEYDLKQSIEWNQVAEDTELIDKTIHGLIEEQAELRPDAIAINGWDAKFTYSEYNEAANRLAHHLVDEQGVKTNDFVHVCFEKSAWHFVSILAINKAGAAWVPLDPSHPPERLKQIVSQTEATVCLVSPENYELCRDLVPNVMEVTAELDQTLSKNGSTSKTGPKTEVTPRSAVYTLFTSGSTGTPKGFVMEHGSVASSQTAVSKRLGLTSDVRMLQFAAFVFDLSIGEIIAPLINGASLNIPSEHTRMNDIKGYIAENNINWAFLTPAYAKTLSPAAVPSLELLLLAGEAVGHDVFDKWFGKVRFVNGWGPAETCVFSTLQEWKSADESPLTVGKPVGGFCWIVDSEDTNKLAPIGTIGEIVIQGPTILREYLANPERTEATTLKTLPDWAPRRNDRGWNRFYKSGDIGFYNADGTIEFSSRKDTQVKIRGLRVELGEVEHHVESALEGVKQVAVDVFKTESGSHLVSYLCFNDTIKSSSGLGPEDVFDSITEELAGRITSMVGEISIHLPRYMIPTVFVPCKFMPSITSTKLDRKGLNKMVSELPRETLREYALQSGKKRAPETAMEEKLQLLWAEILNIPADSIGRDDSFLRIGGDSIAAIHLATVSRDIGVGLSVKDVFDDPRLSAVAAKARELNEDEISTEIASFSLLNPEQKASIEQEVTQQCKLSGEQSIEDAYPATPLQEGLMALAVKQPGSYVAEYTYKIPSKVDVGRFKKAWEETLDHCTNLRTRIATSGDSALQAIVKNDAKWEKTEGLDIQSALTRMKKNLMGYGTRLTQYGFATDKDSQERYFIWRIHHAVFDGWSMRLMLQTLFQAYEGGEINYLQPYSGFVKYTQSIEKEDAEDYWRSQLQDSKAATFPPKPQAGKPSATRQLQTRIELPKLNDSTITKATLLRAAWAIVLAKYSDTMDVTFGTAVSGRQAPVHGLETMAGLMVSTVPIRVKLEESKTVIEFLQEIQAQANNMIPYEQFGLQQTAKLGPEFKEATDFSSLLVVQPANHLLVDTDEDSGAILVSDDAAKEAASSWREGYFSYPLVFQTLLYDDHMDLLQIYDSNVLSENTLTALAHQFETVTKELVAKETQLLSEVSISSQFDLDFAINANKEEPEIVDDLVHNIVERQAERTPDAQAVVAWDAELSYKELSEASNRLANHLIELGVKPRDIVPLCYEKSAWYVVCFLAIIKAGAAWVPVDPSHPSQRISMMISQTNATMALASPQHAEKLGDIVPNVLAVSADLDKKLQSQSSSAPSVEISPDDPVYILFTSGSTGTPKGVVQMHRAVSTAQIAISKRLGVDSSVRMLQFSAFVFDVSIGEMLFPLMHGGATIIPSDQQRMNEIAKFIRDYNVNWASLTPAFARHIQPSEVPALELLILAGEAVSRDVFEQWFGHVRLVNGYGPAETCVYSGLQEWKSKEESPLTIGRPVGGSLWIVDPKDYNKLAPVGTVGEVLIHGPTLLREYLANEEKTQESLITSLPDWAPKRGAHWGRMYKSGDLCSYNPDGTVKYHSRKDTQVKIRGLRVELGEVEHHIRTKMAGVKQVAVDVFKTDVSVNLTSYICFNEDTVPSSSQKESPFIPMTEDVQGEIAAMVGQLDVTLPQYMIPTMFVPCSYMPVNASLKMDKKVLTEMTASLSQEDLAAYSLQGGNKRAPETEREIQLQGLWATILKTSEDNIGRDDSFLRIGGDSITAIQLVNLARNHGVMLSVKDIFDDPRLSEVAKKAQDMDGDAEDLLDVPPFSLLTSEQKDLIDNEVIQKKCALTPEQSIEDAYPCSKTQEGLMILADKNPGSYIWNGVYEIPSHVDVAKFKSAWEKTVEVLPNLRTRIILDGGDDCLQVVVKGPMHWETPRAKNLSAAMDEILSSKMKSGSRLCKNAIIRDSETGKNYFTFTIHHAVFDGWCLSIIMQVLEAAYHDTPMIDIHPYAAFIKFSMNADTESASSFWRSQLEDAQRSSFPPTDQKFGSETTTQRYKSTIELPKERDAGITKASILRAAWAVVMSKYNDSDDVTFASTVSGRNAPLPGLETMPGPAIATVPVRVQMNKEESVSTFMNGLQAQASEMLAHEQFGLQNISKLSDAAREVCDNISSLMVIQPRDRVSIDADALLVAGEREEQISSKAMANYFTYPLALQCDILPNDNIDVTFIYHANILPEGAVDAISHQFNHVVSQLVGSNESLGKISVSGDWDLEKAKSFNLKEPQLIDACVHDMISERASEDAEHEAVYSTTESLTYGEFDRVTSQLASYLADNGVKTETLVPICFEKSIWTVVAMVGIMKAGGAFVPLDPSHPEARRQELVRQVGASLMLASSQHAESCKNLTSEVIEVSPDFIKNLKESAKPEGPLPSNAAYVLFTSGSTGVPKGVVMEHKALCSSVMGHGKNYSLDKSSRVLQFSNYVFDVSLGEILSTLALGGTVCVPNEEERLQKTAEFITSANINVANLTPSFVRTFSPDQVPTLKTLVVGGEAPAQDTLQIWQPHLRLVNGYGPAEACIYCCTYDFKSASEAPGTIGHGANHACWIVDSEDHNQLTPIGCVGELMVQGYALSRGYVDMPEQTANSFHNQVDFLTPDETRFYKTGDLVRYNANGVLEYLGRKDTQVKIRGQRLEVAEIEYTIKKLNSDVDHVAVEVTKRDGKEFLVAIVNFMGQSQKAGDDTVVLPMDESLQNTFTSLTSDLEAALPAYMVPSTFVPVQSMPFVSAMKLDRKKLKAVADGLSSEEIQTYSLASQQKIEPTTEMEFKLRDVWASLLSISADSIGKNDSFLRVGGDSLSAIKLVTLAQQQSISLSVGTIFQNPRLSDMAVASQTGAGHASYTAEPFSLVPSGSLDAIQSELADQKLDDAYPCTSLTEGLMALAVKQPGSYIAKNVYRLPKFVDVEKFVSAWEKTVQLCENLRTRIVLPKGSNDAIQVIISDDICWDAKGERSLDDVLDEAFSAEMQYGSRLCRYALAKKGDDMYFVWTIHHAVFDGWSMKIVLDTLFQAYEGSLDNVSLVPYSGFIKYTMENDHSAAADFWKTQLHDAKRASFPSARSKDDKATRQMKTTLKFPKTTDSSITKATILRAAWAMVLARYCDTDDITFGTTVSGRQAGVLGLDTMPGPMVATVPIRVKFDGKNTTVSQYLQKIQDQATEMVPYEQFGMQKMSHLGPDIQEACDFSSLLVIQPVQTLTSSDENSGSILVSEDTEENLEGYFSYPLVIQGRVGDDGVMLHLIYDSSTLPEQMMTAITSQFNHVVQQLLSQGDSLLETVSVAGEWDLDEAYKLNTEDPEIVDKCIHELIEQQAVERPDALAIRAWDAEFTYKQFNETANRLAHHLVNDFQVQPDELIHVCFEKSAWFFISMLAINKAGGAWVPLDPSHPPQRLQQVVKQTQARLALASPDNKELVSNVVPNVLEVSADLNSKLADTQPAEMTTQGPKVNVTPENAVYVLFTSGSTGTPKGLVMQHGSVATSQTAIGKRLRITPEVKMLQFAAFVFDLCIGEIICPLVHGATLCIPSEHTRMNNLREFVKDMDINWMFLTPAFARTLTPKDVPSVELLLLAGEAVSKDVFNTWMGEVRFINGWGPAETCCFSTLQEWTSKDESPMTVGTPVGAKCWVVDPQDPHRLAPIGTIGEVVLQGPTLLREYLSDPVRTKASTVYDLPAWAPKTESKHWNRFYKSGDLCYYNLDGTLEFASRKDTQIKIRGLRVELGEVEHHIRENLGGARQVAVDVFKTEAGANLVAYFNFNGETKTVGLAGTPDEEIFDVMDEELQKKITAMVGELSVKLPRYMIPSMFIPCKFMPSITSTKLDRNTLKRKTNELGQDALARYSLQDGEKRAPETPMESKLQLLWAEILNLPADTIGRDDSFLRIGGDSITAIRLVSTAREAGISIAVKNIFDDPRLSAVAASATEVDASQTTNIAPFSLLDEETRGLVQDGKTIRSEYDIEGDIEDAYPCTKLQEGLMAIAAKQPGTYVAKYVYEIPERTNLEHFKAAWKKAMEISVNLRTRIVMVNGESTQIVVKEELEWDDTSDHDLKSFTKASQRIEMVYGDRLCRYAIVNDNDGKRYFYWVMHHAIYDGWSMKLALDCIERAYRGHSDMQLTPYSTFINYIQDMNKDEAKDYWQDQLVGATRADFPPHKHTDLKEKKTQLVKRRIDLPTGGDSSVTTATIIRATWAMVLARYCDAEDVCFGTTVSGRNAPVPGIEGIPGTVISTVPIRIRTAVEKKVGEYLKDVQDQAMDMVQYEQYGLQNIVQMGENYKEACDFSSLLVVQPISHFVDGDDAVLVSKTNDSDLEEEGMSNYFTYPLVVQGYTHDDHFELFLIYDPAVLSRPQMETMSEQFENVAQQLITQGDKPMSDVAIAGPKDLETAISFNPETPEIIESTLHDMFQIQAKKHPNKVAISSWDASFTYSQLDKISDRLAHHLIDDFGINKGDIVHCCFEKSGWYTISIMAVNKAGAMWSPLDPAHPRSRQEQVVAQTKAQVIFCSPATLDACEGLAPNLVPVTIDLYEKLDREGPYKDWPATVNPRDGAYVLFTSGSTGTPKGLVMEHGSACTAQVAIGKRLGASENIKMLNFAAFVFDLSVGEIFMPLIHGGTSFIPSEEDRLSGLAQFIEKKGVEWVYLTPAMARTIKPEEVPTLKLMLLAGEAVSRDVFETWVGNVRLINGWGPAETCVFSTLHEWHSIEESPLTIGRPVGGYMWIVDPKNPQKLAPTGTLGEVVIQGPTIMREYIADKQKTEASMVYDLPDWAPRPETKPERWTRFYKSGDLVSYNTDGTLEFSSRKDTQVKIRGLRVELGEVEHTILRTLDSVKQICVDVHKSQAGVFLVAFFSFTEKVRGPGETSEEDLFAPITDELRQTLSELVGELGVKLPRYMVPTLFIPCNYTPSISSGKMDRRTLRSAMTKLSQEEVNSYALNNGKKRAPETAMEEKIQSLWCDILQQAPEQIGRDDNFLQIGGDSIAAIQLVTKARNEGIQLSVKQIFDDPRLSSMATQAMEGDAEELEISEFDLLSDSVREAVLAEAESQCDIPNSDLVQDAYPTSSLQEGLMVLAMKQPGSYLAKYIYKLPSHVDVAKFKTAWEAIVTACDNLRTRIMRAGDQSVQAVIEDDVHWEDLNMDLRSAIATMKDTKVGYGSRMTRYGLVEENGETYFIWVIHHAVFDGWSMKLILGALHEAYNEGSVSTPLASYSGFIKYTESLKNDNASEFWKSQLDGAQRATFPALPSSETKSPTANLSSTIAFPAMKSTITKATVIRAAWAIVLGRYSDSQDITFGATVSGRNASVPGLETMSGPTIATVPVRVKLDQEKTTGQNLEDIQSHASELIEYEQYGIQNITKLGSNAKEACEFSSLLLIQPAVELGSGGDAILSESSMDTELNDTLEGFFSYPLVLQGHVGADKVDLTFTYQSDIVSESQLSAVSKQFEHVVQQLLDNDKPLSQVTTAGPWDLQKAIEWNEEPQLVEDCVFNMIGEKAAKNPEKEAIFSTEASLSFKELDDLSSQLAHYLSNAGVKAETLIPICFEKSIWAIVAMVGIMKAGGVFVPIDPEHPVSRRKSLIEEVNGQIMVVSSKSAESSDGLASKVVILSEDLRNELSSLPTDGFTRPSADNTAYVLFTSGSTGKPKALTMQHSALCSSIIGHGKSYGLNEDSRVLQFSNYVFDVSLGEIFTTLAHGGTVCVPSDQERLSGTAQFMSDAKVSVAMLTTSFVRTFSPEQVPTLKTLVVGGEAPAKDTLQTWFDRVKLINGYGPAEACIYCCTNVFQSKDDSPTTIGRGANHATWVVDVDDHNKLTPVGCVGELMLHGYALSKGYINNEEMTKASFVEEVSWMPEELKDEKKRMYKTGDLVRYNADGTLEYLGRRDRQVKVRGQRIELAEIEHAIKRVDEQIDHAAVDMLKREGRDTLVAFVSLVDENSDGEDQFITMTDDLRKAFTTLSDNLKDALPSYMVPTLFLPVRNMPFVSAMKLDRKKLKEYGDELTKEQLSSFSLASQVKAELKTEMEAKLRGLWAQVIGCAEEEIGRTDSFLRVGGDSITAIQLVTLAQQNGINLSVTTIFQNPKLGAMATAAESATENAKSYDTEPFEMLPEGEEDKIKGEVLKQCDLPENTVIQDIYPTTSLQDGLVALAVKQPGSYIANHMYKIPETTNVTKLKAAWEKTIESCDNLRMRIIRVGNKSYQALIQDDIHWETDNISSVDEFETAKSSWQMAYGTPLSRYAIINDPDGNNYFSWVAHHAAYDGWTTQVVTGTLNQFYRDQTPELHPFSNFIKYLGDVDEAEAKQYWQNQLADAKKASFPPQKHYGAKAEEKVTKHLTKKVPLKMANSSITKATVVRAAWAMVLARYCGTDDVTFGTTVSGRNASVPGIQSMAGPMVATMPIRVHVDSKRSVSKFVQDIQNQANEMISYEQYGLQNISKVSEEAKDACEFSSLLVVQPYQRMSALSGGDEAAVLEHANGEEGLEKLVQGFFNYPLVFQAIVSEDEIELLALYDEGVLNELQLQTLMEQVATRIGQLAEKLEKKSEKKKEKGEDGEKKTKKKSSSSKYKDGEKRKKEKKSKKSSKE